MRQLSSGGGSSQQMRILGFELTGKNGCKVSEKTTRRPCRIPDPENFEFSSGSNKFADDFGAIRAYTLGILPKARCALVVGGAATWFPCGKDWPCHVQSK